MPNALVAALSSEMLTIHCELFWSRAAVSLVSWVPSKTVGPSTYLSPLGSQETIWFFGMSHWSPASEYPTLAFQSSSTVVSLAPGLHTSLLNSFMVAAFTSDGSPYWVEDAEVDDVAVGVGLALAFAVLPAFAVVLAVGVVLAFADAVADGLASAADSAWVEAFGLALAVAPADGVGEDEADDLALPVAVADGLAELLALAEALGVAVTGAVYACSRYTGRNASLAVELTRLSTAVGGLPGIVTSSRLLPSGCTWAPELPVPFTRASRTETACCIAPGDGAWPLGVAACSTTSVPLDRSSPRLTLNWFCQLPGLNVWLPVIEKNMIRIRTASPASARPGWEPLLRGGATCRLPLSVRLLVAGVR